MPSVNDPAASVTSISSYSACTILNRNQLGKMDVGQDSSQIH